MRYPVLPSPNSKKPRRAFSTAFKLKVITAAETSSNREQAMTVLSEDGVKVINNAAMF
jgi:hypothetical protein